MGFAEEVNWVKLTKGCMVNKDPGPLGLVVEELDG